MITACIRYIYELRHEKTCLSSKLRSLEQRKGMLSLPKTGAAKKKTVAVLKVKFCNLGFLFPCT